MKLNAHLIAQAFVIGAQYLNMTAGFFPQGSKPQIGSMIALGAIQGGIGVYNHFFNVDGTSQREPFNQ